MASLSGFNANDVEPAGDFSPIPDGDYVACIVDSKMKGTKNGDGQFLELQLQVVEGEYQGRFIWDRLNLDNPNEKAVSIARGTLSAICRAVGKMTPDDSNELHAIPMLVKVTRETWGDDGQTSNKVKSYKALNGHGTQEQPAKPAPSSPSSPSKADKKGPPPWGKGKPPF